MKHLSLLLLIVAFGACAKKESPAPSTAPQSEETPQTNPDKSDTLKTVEKEIAKGKQIAVFRVAKGNACHLEVRNLNSTVANATLKDVVDSALDEKLTACEAYDRGPSDFANWAAVKDMNFDNKEDFTIVNFLPAGPNVPYFIFLSSLDGKTFTQNAAFEEITTPEIDTKTQTIISNWRDGAATYGKSIYKLENNKPVMIEEQIATFDADGKCMASMKRLVDGTLKEVDKRPCPPEITE